MIQISNINPNLIIKNIMIMILIIKTLTTKNKNNNNNNSNSSNNNINNNSNNIVPVKIEKRVIIKNKLMII